MKPVRLTPAARDELVDTISYYASHRPEFGESFRDEFVATVKRIRELPAAARKVRGEIRRRSILKFPHYVLYRVTKDNSEILVICHRRRSPTYRKIEDPAEIYVSRTATSMALSSMSD